MVVPGWQYAKQTEKQAIMVKKHLTKAWFMRKYSILITENLCEIFSKNTVIFNLRAEVTKSSYRLGLYWPLVLKAIAALLQNGLHAILLGATVWVAPNFTQRTF